MDKNQLKAFTEAIHKAITVLEEAATKACTTSNSYEVYYLMKERFALDSKARMYQRRYGNN